MHDSKHVRHLAFWLFLSDAIYKNTNQRPLLVDDLVVRELGLWYKGVMMWCKCLGCFSLLRVATLTFINTWCSISNMVNHLSLVFTVELVDPMFTKDAWVIMPSYTNPSHPFTLESSPADYKQEVPAVCVRHAHDDEAETSHSCSERSSITRVSCP